MWGGMNDDYCMACAGLKEASKSRWITVRQDMGTTHKQMLTLIVAQQALAELITKALSRALMAPDLGDPTTGGREACFRC